MNRAKVAWVLAGATMLLLVASFTGRGVGPWGVGLMTHMAWSYVFLILLAASLMAIGLDRKSSPAG